MIVLIDGVRYQLVRPEKEDWLEKIVQDNSEHIFGSDSFYFDKKKLIRSKAGVASIPDGYAIYFTPKPQWAVVEVELASHSVDNHLIPQLSKFIRAIDDNQTRRELIGVFFGIFKEDEVLKARLKQRIKTGDVHEFISELVFQDPLIVVVIDEQTKDLKEALRSLRVNVKVVEFKTFRREGISEDVNAFVFEPLSTKTIIPNKSGSGVESSSGPEPQFSEFRALKANATTRVSIDARTLELLRTPGGMRIEEIHRILCEEYPDHNQATLWKTTKRRLHGHLQKKYGIRIIKDAEGKYSIE